MKDLQIKILIVDDLEQNLLFLEALLEQLHLDIEIVKADSGFAAIDLVQQHEFAMVILDVQMQGLDGFETLAKIRKTKNNENLPVIFLSGIYTDDNYKLKGLKSGAIDFIAKPFKQELFLAKVSVFIELFKYQKGRDILLRKLQESESKFKKMSMVAFDAVIVTNKEYKVTFWNHAAEKIFGYNKHEIEALSFKDLFSPAKYNYELPESIMSFFESEDPNKLSKLIEITAIKKTRMEFSAELSVSSFTLDKKFYILCTIRDISRRQRIEKELLKAKEAKEANKVMREFIDNLNHELNTPLNAIIGISRRLIKGDNSNLTEKQREAINIIKSSGERLNNLVASLFEFRKKPELEFQNINISDFCNDIDEYIKSKGKINSIEFIIQKSTPLPKHIHSDYNVLYTVLTNLIDNAVKFTEVGYIKIDFLQRDGFFIVHVEDTGIGIKDEDLKEIFKKFVQVDGSSSRKYGGTGLGLALCNKLIKQLGGKILVKSQVGLGTTFTVKIPLDSINYGQQ